MNSVLDNIQFYHEVEYEESKRQRSLILDSLTPDSSCLLIM